METDLLLANFKKHIQLSEEEEQLICQSVKARFVKKNQFLVHEGAVQRCTNFVNKGCLRTYFIDPEGQEHIVQFAFEGWWISDLHSFLMQVPATFNVQAVEDTDLLELPHDVLEELYQRVPKLEKYFRVITQRAFGTFQQRIVQKISMSAEDRYLAFLAKYPGIELRLPQRFIASYLGVSAEFISKIKNRRVQKDK